MVVAVLLPRSIVEYVRREAEKLGLSLEEYIVDVLVQGLDPRDRAVEYIEAAKELLEEAREELKKGNIRQAAEKIWGTATLAAKAYAWWRENKRLTSHRELWEYSKKVADELGEWVSHAWNEANAMHICFYEGWCLRGHVEAALRQIERLVREIEAKVKG